MKIADDLRQMLLVAGYRCAAATRSEFTMFYRYEGRRVYIVHTVEAGSNFYYDSARMQNTVRDAEMIFREKGYSEIESFVLVITDNMNYARTIADGRIRVWFVQIPENRLVIFENQPGEMFGLHDRIEEVLRSSGFGPGNSMVGDFFGRQRQYLKLIRPVTISIIIINCIVYLYLAFRGDPENADFMYQHGAMMAKSLLNGEWYRLFTSVFMHFGLKHLGSNMLVLCLIGSMLERNIGKAPFAVIYLLCGLGGNVLSAYMSLSSGGNVVSAGASGAIFGIMGGLLCFVLLNRGKVENLSTRQIFIFVALSLYQGFTSQGVDNAAHVGGVITGVVVTFIYLVMVRRIHYTRNER